MLLEPLRFRRLELVQVRLPLRFAFRHAAAARRSTEALIVLLHGENGVVGYGEVIPRAYLTGETLAGCWQELGGNLWPRLKELRFAADTSPAVVLADLHKDADRRRQTAAYAGLDLAVFDAWGKRFGVPGSRLLGTGGGEARPLTAVVGMGMPPALVARGYKAAGFRVFKVKAGDGYDIARVAAVRRVLGGEMSLRIDANGAWNARQAQAVLAAMREFGLESVEQPLPASDGAAALTALQRATGVPVQADESLCTSANAEALLAAGGSLGWNLRLAKVGGFTGLLRLARLAQEKRLCWQLGALVGETSLLTAAARACLGLDGLGHVESSFPEVLLRLDPFRGGPQSWRGTAAPLGERAGLGVELDQARLTRVTVKRAEYT